MLASSGLSLEKDGGTVPAGHLNENRLEPGTEKTAVTFDEESEWSGISSTDNEAVSQQLLYFYLQLPWWLSSSISPILS